MKKALEVKKNVYSGDHCAIYIQNKNNVSSLAYLHGFRQFNEWDKRLVEIFCSNASIALDNAHLYDQIRMIQEAAITSLAKLAEFKDIDTGGHIQRVADMTGKIAEYLHKNNIYTDETDELFLQQISLASILHDIGKVGIPEKILLKPSKLTDDEWKIVKKHPVIGGEILQKAAEKLSGRNYLSISAEIALCHHEKFDGSGYPNGLRGSEIPLSARIVAVVDVYDALISKRPYKNSLTHDVVVEIIKNESGKSFDPEIVNALLNMQDGSA